MVTKLTVPLVRPVAIPALETLMPAIMLQPRNKIMLRIPSRMNHSRGLRVRFGDPPTRYILILGYLFDSAQWMRRCTNSCAYHYVRVLILRFHV